MTILAFDPSGTSISAVFKFHNWSNYQITHFNNRDWKQQVQFFKTQIKAVREEEVLVLYEGSNYCRGANKSFLDLIRAVAGFSLFCYEERVPVCIISSRAVKLAKKEARKNKIRGLGRKRGQGWTFRGQALANEHELDALLVFYVFWVKRKGKEWPWSG